MVSSGEELSAGPRLDWCLEADLAPGIDGGGAGVSGRQQVPQALCPETQSYDSYPQITRVLRTGLCVPTKYESAFLFPEVWERLRVRRWE